MQIKLSEDQLKKAIWRDLVETYGMKARLKLSNIKKITLHRKTAKSESVGSITVEIEDPD